MENIVGIVGPSGVGKGVVKNFIKNELDIDFREPVIATTRPIRITDGDDRMGGLSVEEFNRLVDQRQIIFPHQPFGLDGHWYGFLKWSLFGDMILTEIHVDNVLSFRKEFCSKLKLIALVADVEYLSNNLKQRGTESFHEMERRLDTAEMEIGKIMEFAQIGIIDSVIEVSKDNREDLFTIIKNNLLKLLNYE